MKEGWTNLVYDIIMKVTNIYSNDLHELYKQVSYRATGAKYWDWGGTFNVVTVNISLIQADILSWLTY